MGDTAGRIYNDLSWPTELESRRQSGGLFREPRSLNAFALALISALQGIGNGRRNTP